MQRSSALDSLRGLAIIGMVFSGTIATGLPAWMYHAQVGPRSGMKFDPTIPGITWVDLVFPFFLFAMGAAIPLAMSSKLERGATIPSLLPGLLKRFFLLAFFAIAIYHTTPYRITGEANYLLALLAFGLFFISFVRLPVGSETLRFCSPRRWFWFVGLPVGSETFNRILNYSGMILLAALIAFNVISQPEVFSNGFKLSHNDIILLVLANMAVFGALIWLLTRGNVTLRLAVMAVIVALKLSSTVEGRWTHWLWNFNPLQWLPESITSLVYSPGGWLYRMDFLKYLLIVLPGTIAGDVILRWMKNSEHDFILQKTAKNVQPSVSQSNSIAEKAENQNFDKRKMIGLLVLSITLVICNLVGLYTRWLVPNFLITLVLTSLGLLLLRSNASGQTKKYHELFSWGTGWLLFGLIVEAHEGGIRKDHATLSYFFVTSGLAIFTYLFFSILTDYFGKGKLVRYITDCGKNPMVAYVAGSFVMVPLLSVTQLMPLINQLPGIHPWLGLVKGIVITGGMMALTVFTVRKKWFWKT